MEIKGSEFLFNQGMSSQFSGARASVEVLALIDMWVWPLSVSPVDAHNVKMPPF